MKLRLPARIYRIFKYGIHASVITLGIQSALAQDTLEPVTIPEGESQTYTDNSSIENKHLIANGTLNTALSGYSITRCDVTVNPTGEWINSKSFLSYGLINIDINGGQASSDAEMGAKLYASAPPTGDDPISIMNLNISEQGIFQNDDTLTAHYAAEVNVTLDNATFINNHQLLAQEYGKVTVDVGEGARFENNYVSYGGNGVLNINVSGEGVVDNYGVIASVFPRNVGAPSLVINVSDGGTLNNYQDIYSFISIQNAVDARIIIQSDGSVNNLGGIGASQQSGMGSSLEVLIDGGSLTNSNENGGGLLYAESYSSLRVQINSGEFLNKGGDLSHSSTSSSLQVDVDGGTFRNEATTGNADIRVGASGLMSGWGSFGSNDVYGTLIVGSGAIGLHDAAVKHQHYSGNFALNSGAELTFYIEDRDNYSQIFVEGTATGSAEWGSIRAAVEVTSEMMAKSVAAGDAFMNPGYIVLVDADGNEQNVSAELGIEYYGVGPFVNKYYYVDPETGSLLPYEGEIEKALLSGSADLIDTLWSSTGSVRNLARTALSQVFLPCYNAERTLCEKAEEMTGQREWQPVHCRRPNVWVAGLGGFMNMGGAAAFTYSGGGYAVGADAPIGQYGRVGAAFGQSFGVFRARHSSTAVDQTGIMFSVYGGFEKPINEKRSHRASAYFGYGVVDNDARTNLMGVESGAANWDDEAFVFGLEYAMDFHVRDNLTISPFIGIEYAYGSQSIYAESFSGGLVRRYDGATMQYWRIPVGCAVRHSCALGGKQYLVSELALGYIGDVSRHNPHGRVNIEGMDFVINGSNPARNAFMLRAGTNWLINEHWTAGAQYNLEARSGEFSQSVNAYVRYSF